MMTTHEVSRLLEKCDADSLTIVRSERGYFAIVYYDGRVAESGPAESLEQAIGGAVDEALAEKANFIGDAR